jgi:two-component system, NtrC family, sensor kinase
VAPLPEAEVVGEILRVIASSPADVQPVFDAIAELAARVCDARVAAVFRVEHDLVHVVAQHDARPAPRRDVAAELRRYYPQPLAASESLSARAIVDGRVVHVADLESEPGVPDVSRQLGRVLGCRGVLSVPMICRGAAVGTISVARAEAGRFSETHLALLRAFANAAVIAVENARLITELEARSRSLATAFADQGAIVSENARLATELQEKNRALTAAHSQVTENLKQQTATSEILRVIGSSPTDVQPVFETIAGNAVSVCAALACAVFEVDGDMLRVAATHGVPAERVERFRQEFPIPLSADHDAAQTVQTRRVFHLADIEHNPSATVTDVENARLGMYRTRLMVPMVRGDRVLGLIAVTRVDPTPFPDQLVELLKTFADQAVIAIENVRLFKELEARNRDLTTALDRQTATADVLRVIAQSPTELQPVLDAIATSAMRLCAASDAVIERLEGDRFYNAAHAGTQMKGLVGLPLPLTRRFPGGRAVLDRRRVIIDDIHLVAEQEYPDTLELLKLNTIHSVAEIPLLSEGKPVGTIAVLRVEVRPFTDAEVTLLETFADQAVIAIENVRLFTELQEKNRALTRAHSQVTEALEQQTATAEILRVISSSPTDSQPVFAALAISAARLCDAFDAAIHRLDGDVLCLVAHEGPIEPDTVLPLEHGTLAGHVVRERRAIQVADMQAEVHVYPLSTEFARHRGFRTILGVPLLRRGEVLGIITIRRTEVRPFTDKQAELLRTFADQAVIAIENVRLFEELQVRTMALTRSVGQLTALGDVGRAVSSTLDLDTVLTTIVARAVQLAEMDAGAIYEYDEVAEVFRLRATQNLPEEFLGIARPMAIRKGEGAAGRLAVTREPVQIPDITPPDAYQSRLRDVLLRLGHRAVLAVPLLAEDHIVGSLIVTRTRPGDFPPDLIDLLKTFATQSALAIQNARLFREIEDKSRQLETASQHKSEFLANMSHELRTPLNAIIGFSEVLTDRMFGDLNEKQEEYLNDIYASGTHLLSLINDILDLSKIEAGRMELELTDFHLPTALDNALTLVRERAGRRSITLQMTVDERLGDVRADDRKIRQVVLNLLSNAIKFTPEGGRIEVAAAPKDGAVEVSVSDTGVGIAPEDQEAVFEEFRQVGTADKKAEGTGLGLTLCRKFIELHGGRIRVKSQVGEGSTFSFTIPVPSRLRDNAK